MENLTALGYTVGEAFTVPDGPTVYRIEHPDLGLSIMVRDDEEDTLANLADPEKHEARLNPPEPEVPDAPS